ncbi:DEAD/DEAH box helicase family protein [Legionella shakespearei]|uniref:Type III restriction enzyme, res subunit n=1 Tax=Legionella shakespearei DSM 23087 TaxID=1122169 RepID=A0A0W0Z2L9_9GAMM|nr:DEAD/DEAH box helicase family protein [Legionella shakespearei]KTD63339.1 Type III restriction enzyme, res subunit [Legionella shakespearei DSM 23087]
MTGAKAGTVKAQADDLKNYADTIAAVHLLKEALNKGAVVSIGSANQLIKEENDKAKPELGNIVKQILAKAGRPGETQSQWVKGKDNRWQLEAAITIGGAVYTVKFEHTPGNLGSNQYYDVQITSKLNQQPGRGKLFFDESHTAQVKLMVDKEGDYHAVTSKGLTIGATSFTPYPYQNEILSKFGRSLADDKGQRLAIMGTGSGKSIIMAGIAQAVGRTVMIVPDETLVGQQSSEVRSMLGAGKVNGNTKIPTVFTLNNLKDLQELDIDWEDQSSLDNLSEDEKELIRNYFRKVINGTSIPAFDQIVLQSEHPLFKIIAPEIKDSMVLIDESHRHTFRKEDAVLLSHIKEHNSVLALTATPTSELYEIFKGEPLDDLSLGGAIQLGTIRPVKPEVSYEEDNNLVTQAVTHYFNDYYLADGMNGYTDPVALKAELMKPPSSLPDATAETQAVEKALALNRIRAQRNMGFSDSPEIRSLLAHTYQQIAQNDVATMSTYQSRVAALRHSAEIDARLAMSLKLHPTKDEAEIAHRKEEITKQTPLPVVDLAKDIQTEQQKDIQRTINSYALALIFGERPAKIAEKDRTHKLEEQLKGYDKEIAKFDGNDAHGTNSQIPPQLLSKFKECKEMSREVLAERLNKMGPPISRLPQSQKQEIIKRILDRAEGIVSHINESKPITAMVLQAEPINMAALGATKSYATVIDMNSEQRIVDELLAQTEVGLAPHVISDQRIATGVSIKDVLNVQIINNYSPVVESDPNVINGTLSGPQAAGRCVRNDDVSARVQQFIDKRYENKGLILTVDAIIDPEQSAKKTKEVMTRREQQAQKEYNTALHEPSPYSSALFDEQQDTLNSLSRNIGKKEKKLTTLKALLEDSKLYLITTQAKLHRVETALAFVPGNPADSIPVHYRNDHEKVVLWAARKLLPKVIKGIEEKNAEFEKAIKKTSEKLLTLQERRDQLQVNEQVSGELRKG